MCTSDNALQLEAYLCMQACVRLRSPRHPMLGCSTLCNGVYMASQKLIQSQKQMPNLQEVLSCQLQQSSNSISGASRALASIGCVPSEEVQFAMTFAIAQCQAKHIVWDGEAGLQAHCSRPGCPFNLLRQLHVPVYLHMRSSPRADTLYHTGMGRPAGPMN